MATDPKKRGRRAFLMLVALFAVPVAFAWWAYLTDWRPARTINYGTLLDPAVDVSQQFQALDAADGGRPFLLGRWTILHVVAGRCEEACMQELWVTQQVWKALGKDRERVQRAVIGPEAATRAVQAELAARNAVPVTRLRGPWQALGTPAATVYVIDPRGYAILRYPRPLEPKGLSKDLQRLLKVSHIG